MFDQFSRFMEISGELETDSQMVDKDSHLSEIMTQLPRHVTLSPRFMDLQRNNFGRAIYPLMSLP